MDSNNEDVNMLDSSQDLFDDTECSTEDERGIGSGVCEHSISSNDRTDQQGITQEANKLVHNMFSKIRDKLDKEDLNLSKHTTSEAYDNTYSSTHVSKQTFSGHLIASNEEDLDAEDDSQAPSQAKKKFRSHELSLASIEDIEEDRERDELMEDECKVEIHYDHTQPVSKDSVKVSIRRDANEKSNQETELRFSQAVSDVHDLKTEAISGDKKDFASTEIDEQDAEDEIEIKCPFCNMKEITVDHLQIHILLKHPDTSTSNNHKSITVRKEDNVHTNDKHDLPVSMESDILQFVCPLCDLDLGDALTLELHMDAIHTEEHQAVPGTCGESCPLCDMTCESEQAMKQHLKTHDSDQTFYGISTPGEATGACFSPPDLSCPMCGLQMLDTDLLTSHVESHFNPKHSLSPSYVTVSEVTEKGNKENVPVRDRTKTGRPVSQKNQEMKKKLPNGTGASPSTSQSRWSPSSSKDNVGYKRQYEQNLERAVVQGKLTVEEYYEQRRLISDGSGYDNGQTRTDGLMDKLQALYNNQARAGQMVYLCSDTAHFSGSYGDKGWGCGYRNFQMIMSCLVRNPDYSGRISEDGIVRIPSIPKLQQMLELAWRKGFDPQGCQQLGGRVVDTRKWIGATEIVTLLSSLGIKCRLIDFHAPSTSDGTHPRLFEWVRDYFTMRRQQFLPPLYLQHQGHSRTIVGVDIEKGVTRLLLFDPGVPRDHMRTLAKGHLAWKDMRTFRRTIAGFKAKQYQIVAVMGLLTDAEYEDSKTLRSDRVC